MKDAETNRVLAITPSETPRKINKQKKKVLYKLRYQQYRGFMPGAFTRLNTRTRRQGVRLGSRIKDLVPSQADTKFPKTRFRRKVYFGDLWCKPIMVDPRKTSRPDTKIHKTLPLRHGFHAGCQCANGCGSGSTRNLTVTQRSVRERPGASL